MTMNEKKQVISLCAATLQKMNGKEPGFEELCSALGSEYTILLTEYCFKNKKTAAA